MILGLEYMHSQQCNCLHSLGMVATLQQPPNPSNNEPPPQVLNQIVNLSCLLCFSCQNLDEVAQNHQLSPVPLAMVNLETWIPNNYQVEDWQVEDVGRLGPGGRLVHFIMFF